MGVTLVKDIEAKESKQKCDLYIMLARRKDHLNIREHIHKNKPKAYCIFKSMAHFQFDTAKCRAKQYC